MPSLSQKYPVHTEWSDEDECFVATCAQFPGLIGSDDVEAIAIAELREAIDMAIEVMLEEGRAVPEIVQMADFSGQFRLRLLRSMHAALARRAGDEGVSLNTLAQTYIACGLANDYTSTKAAQRLNAAVGPITTAAASLADNAASIRRDLAATRRPLTGNTFSPPHTLGFPDDSPIGAFNLQSASPTPSHWD
jgi:predicted HicB family RNase H-like nuclease